MVWPERVRITGHRQVNDMIFESDSGNPTNDAVTHSGGIEEVSIWIDREGTWFYQGHEILRRDIVRLFYRNLHLDAATSRYFIQIGSQRCYVSVEDAPYSVRAVQPDSSGDRIYLQLSDDSREKLDPETLHIGSDNVMYCRVKAGRFLARFCSSAYYRLAESIEYDPLRAAYFLPLKQKVYYIGLCAAARK